VISNLLALICATILSGAVLYFIRLNYQSAKQITVRGNRLMFCLLLVIGFILIQTTFHLYVNCNLTQPNSVCEIGWI